MSSLTKTLLIVQNDGRIVSSLMPAMNCTHDNADQRHSAAGGIGMIATAGRTGISPRMGGSGTRAEMGGSDNPPFTPLINATYPPV